jgi:hypothetical protein
MCEDEQPDCRRHIWALTLLFDLSNKIGDSLPSLIRNLSQAIPESLF